MPDRENYGSIASNPNRFDYSNSRVGPTADSVLKVQRTTERLIEQVGKIEAIKGESENTQLAAKCLQSVYSACCDRSNFGKGNTPDAPDTTNASTYESSSVRIK